MIRIKVWRLVFALTTLLLVNFIAASNARAQFDITAPDNNIVIVNGTDDGDGSTGPPPPGEGVANAIDNTTNKYLNFLDLGSGFTVTPLGSTTIQALRIYTANDEEARDPASYLLEGSNNSGATFTLISQGPLALPGGRNALGQAITTPGLFGQTVTFANSTSYATYRLTFPTLKNAGTNVAMQIGEAELLSNSPTAAGVTVGGRVLSFSGRSVKSARVSLSAPNGENRTAITNPFGYFSFQDVLAGETYVFNVNHKRYRFTPQALTVTSEITNLTFVAEP